MQNDDASQGYDVKSQGLQASRRTIPPRCVDDQSSWEPLAAPTGVEGNDDALDVAVLAQRWLRDGQKFVETTIEQVFQVVKEQVVHALSLPPCKDYLSVVLCDDDMIQQLNATHRGRNRPTNCLSFPSGVDLLTPLAHPRTLGEIFLSVTYCAREARQQSKTFHDHATHLFIHSLLHLYGYDHETDAEAKVMEMMECQILKDHFAIQDPYRTMGEH